MDLSKALCRISSTMKVRYTLNDKPKTHEEVFSDTGLLPAMARRADQLASLCLGYGIGATFDEVDQSVLGVRVEFDDITPNVLRLACLVDVIYELVESAPEGSTVPLDELMYD